MAHAETSMKPEKNRLGTSQGLTLISFLQDLLGGIFAF